jgi:hypothetical protein
MAKKGGKSNKDMKTMGRGLAKIAAQGKSRPMKKGAKK